MALVDNAWYVNFGDGSTTGYYAQTKWATGASIAAGALRRQNAAPSVGNERMFVCVVAGTTHASTEPTWGVTRGAKTTDNTVTWQECTGIAALNGDATNTPNWTTVKNTAVTLGQVIKRNNGASYQICTTAGTAGNGSEPSFSDSAGATTADNTVTWTSLGVVGNFTGWQAPHARLGNAMTTNWVQAGNKVFVGDNHAETQASAMTLTSVGTATLPLKVICVDHAGSVPPVSADLKTTATISVTGGSNTISFAGSATRTTYDGIQFSSGNSTNVCGILFSNSGSNSWVKLRNCKLSLAGNDATSRITINTQGVQPLSIIELENTQLSFANAGQRISLTGGILRWRNTPTAIQGTAPTKLFLYQFAGGELDVAGVDFSAMGSGKTLFDQTNVPEGFISVFSDCKIDSALVISAVASAPGSDKIDMWRVAGDGTNYRFFRNRYEGTQSEETTIVRTGGASDGTTTIASKIVTSANTIWDMPFVSQPIDIWNDVISPTTRTATIYGIWGGGAVPNNDDIWIEAEYLGASGNPQGSFVNSGKADILAASTGNTSDASSWGGSTTAFKMAVTFTAAQKGLVRLRVKAAKPSTTFYIDPKVALS